MRLLGEQTDSPRKLFAIRLALDELNRTGGIGEAVFFKGLVILAARWARLGDLAQAHTLVTIPTDEYYRTIQVVQMDDDPDYRDVAVYLANAFVEAGMVALDDGPAPTQKPASA